MISHHLDDATLIALSSGTLNSHLALAATAHIELCPQCRAGLHLADHVGGTLLSDQPPASIAQNGLERCWNLIEAKDRPAAREPAPAKVILQPPVLAEFLPSDLDRLPWRRITGKVELFPLNGLGAEPGWIRLFRFQPGAIVPSHRHADGEISLVLQGSYQDELGRFAVGDVEDLVFSDQHRPAVDSTEPCIVLIATSGPIEFTSMLHRLRARLFGI